MATRKKTTPAPTRTSGAVRSIRVRDYFNSAVKSFSIADCYRSIPGVDGMKISQRKALYGTLIRGENAGELQVERLASHIASCVTGETKILMADGNVEPIARLVRRFDNGERFSVCTFNVNTGKYEIKRVTNAFLTKVSTHIVEVTAEGRTARMTPEHRVLTQRGWVEAKDLTYSDFVLVHSENVNGSPITSISIEEEAVEVFDLTVEDNHNFFANGILVHNCTDYHHGAGSMASTIVNMAVTKIPGANNMNLFEPEGQFGSRLTKEAGAGRYIFSRLTPYFRQLFRKEDDIILEHNYVDGQKIEPKLFLPILPLVLINGASGTGTGHGCEIKSYHPNQVRDACVKVLDGKNLKTNSLVPWFRGFNGEVERNEETGQVVTYGVLEVVNTTTIKISELPIGRFVDDYKEILNKLEEEGFIKDYDDASTEDSFNFTITVPRTTTALGIDELYTKFKLISRDTENFTLWTPEGTLHRFNSAEEVLKMYVGWRVGFYEVRRQRLIEDVSEDIRYASEVIRFIKFFMANTKMFRDTSKADLIAVLMENNFADYDRLLSMPIWSLTHDRINDMNTKLANLKERLAELEADDASSMYRRELLAFKYTSADEQAR